MRSLIIARIVQPDDTTMFYEEQEISKDAES